ncbi:ADP-ribosylglycohydrolase family protein [Paraburkholderia domus]|uniref:ADP-ribosylglycohydrolase family protein n=1 Tax=Paraburkholderia domus TaxID=2793075 RepID=UPI001913D6B6|nr:ADP-ribosylglycohydrolase family protein [Paraburkholderia domus]MBK5180468.1 ADP-ribosylglycohydrolase family protein [Burkholderia sp. R-69749]CAE6801580.1 ADP-ribosylarginine hydrolase Tri1 [Paraburkholderia domus]
MTNETGFIGLRGCTDARIAGLVGLLCGDAVGVGFEFKKPAQIPSRDQIEMTTAVGFRRSHAGVPVGTWSDDGAQALCLLASLLQCGRFQLIDFADRLLRWYDDGYLAVDADVFDVGVQTAEALGRLRDGVSPRESGGAAVMDNGNGSLMRVLPLALWHTGPEDALVRDAHLQSLPTHGHARSLVACAFYCLVAKGYLRNLADPWSSADQRLEEIYAVWSDQPARKAFLVELDVLRSFPKTDQPRGTGYVLDTIWSARKALEEDSFEDVARTAILFGHDTDTTAAVACGLAGIKFGIDGIPVRWLEQLRGFEIVEPLIRQFMAMS